MKVTRFENSPCGENVYLLWNEMSKHALVIDPGMMSGEERDAITHFIEEQNLVIKQVLLTHCHVDHIASARWIAQHYQVTIAASEADAPLANALEEQVQRFHLRLDASPLSIDQYLHEGDSLMLDDEEIKVIETPGHTPGGLVFYVANASIAFTGDSIFMGSVGRTDLPGGNMQQLINALRDKVLTLPDETVLAPGHGPTTTVAQEQAHNPFLQL